MEKIRFVNNKIDEGSWEGGALLDELHSLGYSVEAVPVHYEYRLMRDGVDNNRTPVNPNYVPEEELNRMALLIVGSKNVQPQG